MILGIHNCIYLTVVHVSGAGDPTSQPGVTSPPALLEETPHRTQQEWSYLFGGEEQELQAMVEELLTGFPTLTTEREPATSAASFPGLPTCHPVFDHLQYAKYCKQPKTGW